MKNLITRNYWGSKFIHNDIKFKQSKKKCNVHNIRYTCITICSRWLSYIFILVKHVKWNEEKNLSYWFTLSYFKHNNPSEQCQNSSIRVDFSFNLVKPCVKYYKTTICFHHKWQISFNKAMSAWPMNLSSFPIISKNFSVMSRIA